MGFATPPVRIAIVDGSPAFAAAAAAHVAALPGCVVVPAVESADLVLVDLGAAPARGLEALLRIRSLPGAPAVAAMTLFHSPETAAAAIAAGAVGLVGKDRFVSDLNELLAGLFPTELAA